MAIANLRRFGARFGSGVKRSGVELELARLYLRAFPSVRFKIFRSLARLLDVDIDARSALEFIQDVQTDGGRKSGDFVAVALRVWIERHREHGRLSEALTGWAPTSEILLIEAGERSGRFRQALDVMLRLDEKRAAIRSAIGSKLLYPLASALAFSGVTYFLATNFLPSIVALKPDARWTGSAATTIVILEWAGTYLIPTLIGLLLAVIAIFATLPFFRGPVRSVFDRVAPWSVHRFTAGAAFLTAVLVLMESGKGLVDALALTKSNASPYLRTKIERVQAELHEGIDFGRALARSGDQFPDRELVKEIQLFDRIGRLDEDLLPIVEAWMDHATERTKAQIGFLSSLILAATVLGLGTIFSGIYNIVDQLKGAF